MCFFRIIVLAVLLHGCISVNFPSYRECSEGDTRAEGCNTCFCMASGWELCTGRCPEPEKATEPPQPVPVLNRMVSYRHTSVKHRLREPCMLGDTFGEGCNKCYCNAAGLWLCTGFCPTPEPNNRFDSQQTAVTRARPIRLMKKHARAARPQLTEVMPSLYANPSGFHVPLPRPVFNKHSARMYSEDSETDDYGIFVDDYEYSSSDTDTDVSSSGLFLDNYFEDDIPMMVGFCAISDITTEVCDICSCVDGKWLCTGSECPQTSVQDHDIDCKEGDTRTEVCTTCHCTGRKWVCSSFCPGRLDLHSRVKSYQQTQRDAAAISRSHMLVIDKKANCVFGHISEEKCSKCYCIAPGKWVCVGTCPHKKTDERDDPEGIAQTHIIVTDDASECVVGKAFTATCGRCFCMAPGWLVCTGLCHEAESDALQLLKKAKQLEAFAHPDERKENPACRVGEIIHLDCYECLCTAAGMMSCLKKACLRGRLNLKQPYNMYHPTPVPNEIEVHYKKLGYGPDYCPVGKVIQTTDCSLCTCVMKEVMVCTKNNCEKSMQGPSYKNSLSVKPLSSGGPNIEYEAEYYDLDY